MDEKTKKLADDYAAAYIDYRDKADLLERLRSEYSTSYEHMHRMIDKTNGRDSVPACVRYAVAAAKYHKALSERNVAEALLYKRRSDLVDYTAGVEQ